LPMITTIRPHEEEEKKRFGKGGFPSLGKGGRGEGERVRKINDPRIAKEAPLNLREGLKTPSASAGKRGVIRPELQRPFRIQEPSPWGKGRPGEKEKDPHLE